MKQILKRTIALLCALALVCGGIMTQGDSQTAKASSETASEAYMKEYQIFSSESGVNILNSSKIAINKSVSDIRIQLPNTIQMENLTLVMKVLLQDTDAVALMSECRIELGHNGEEINGAAYHDSHEIQWTGISTDELKVTEICEIYLPLTDAINQGEGIDLNKVLDWWRIYTNNGIEQKDNAVMLYEVKLVMEGVVFGETDSYLQLSEPLTTTPSAVEATVKMEECKEWTIISAESDEANIYSSPHKLTAEENLTIEACPDESLSYSGATVATGAYFGFQKKFDIAMSDVYENEDIALAFWIYNPNDTLNGTLEITSAGTADNQEISWSIGKDVTVKQGWNYIKLPLDTATAKIDNGASLDGAFELQNVNFVRWHSTTNNSGEAVTYAISDMKLVVLEDNSTDWMLVSAKTQKAYATSNSNHITTGNDTTPGAGMEYAKVGTGTVKYQGTFSSIDVSTYSDAELAVGFWIYSSQTLNEGRFELSSSGESDLAELEWQFGPDVKVGWNYVELPLTEYYKHTNTKNGVTEDFSKTTLNFVRIHTLTTSDGTIPEIYISDIKLVHTGLKYGFGNATSNSGFRVEDTYTTIATDLPGGGVVCQKFTASNLPTSKVEGKWQITDSAKVINLGQYTTDKIALAFWIYSDIANPTGYIELGSSGNEDDSNEYQISFADSGIQAGWNYMELPLSSIAMTGTVNLSSINFMRLHSMVIEGENSILMSEPAIKILETEEYKVTESSEIFSAHMIFSNVNAEDVNVYALAVTKEGYPSFIYGNKQYTLNYDIQTNEVVALKVVRNNNGKIEFYVNGELKATSESATNTLGAPITAYCIGADGLGKQLMQGYIGNVRVSDEEETMNAAWAISQDVSRDVVDAVGSEIYAEYKGTAVQACPYVTRYYGNIGNYRETIVDEKYTKVPEKTEYVFAGWYDDEKCTKPLAVNIASGKAYAKFVDKKILTVQAQARYTANSDNAKLDIRYITTVDTLNYKEVGFIVTNRAGVKSTYQEQNVYWELDAAGVTYEPNNQEYFSAHSTRFATIQMTGVPISGDGFDANREIPVQAYWITQDGSIVYGAERTVKVSDAVNSANMALSAN